MVHENILVTWNKDRSNRNFFYQKKVMIAMNEKDEGWLWFTTSESSISLTMMNGVQIATPD